MSIETFLDVLTVSVVVEEETFGHLSNVVFVEKLAGIALLAEALEPVLADNAGTIGFVDGIVGLAKVEV